MPLKYSTRGIASKERFDYWRDVICDAYLPIECDTPNRSAFDGVITLQRFSQLDLSRVQGSPQHVTRKSGDIARNADAYFMLSMQLSNTSNLTQSGRTSVLRPDDFALYSTTEPYEIICQDDVDQLVIQLRYDDLLARVPHADLLTGLRVDGQTGVGAMVSKQMRECARTIGTQSETIQRHLQDMLIDLVATGLSSLSESRFDLARPEQLLLGRAKATIRAHLREHQLDRHFVANAMGMSARNLARSFERDDMSIAGFIRKSRLEAIAADLVDPRMVAKSISEIACKWGITNFQHFSRLFKETYGITPRDYRNTRRNLQ